MANEKKKQKIVVPAQPKVEKQPNAAKPAKPAQPKAEKQPKVDKQAKTVQPKVEKQPKAEKQPKVEKQVKTAQPKVEKQPKANKQSKPKQPKVVDNKPEENKVDIEKEPEVVEQVVMDLSYQPSTQQEDIAAPIPQENVEIKVDDTPASEADIVTAPEQEPKKEEKKKKLSKEYLRSPLNRVDTDPDVGLTEAQLQERIDKGFINFQKNVTTKSYFSIFRSNVLTLFNFINFALGCAVLVFGQVKNALFLGLVIFNMVVGIFQEVRAKKTLEKMSIMTAPTVEVIRNKNSVSSRTSIPADRIALDDIIILKQGAQVPVDCIVVGGECDVNESLLTGESDDIHKTNGDNIYSGSTIQAGEIKCRVTAVGENSYSSKLLAEAKKFKKTKSKLMTSINWIIRIVTILLFPLGILMFLNNYNVFDHVLSDTVTRTVSSMIGMIPEGLIVLTSIALAAGVYKLAKKRTLVQDLYSIETLARVDVLCLDKTGTITEGSMQVEQEEMFSTKYGDIADIVGNMVKALGKNNATFEAFADHYKQKNEYEVIKTVPFSSARKWSGVNFGINGTFIVGAPEFVLKDRFGEIKEKCEGYAKEGYRVLVLVTTHEKLTETMDSNRMNIVALIVLSDKIRENAKATFEYFAQQGVTLKVISGDNPVTVSKVAERAGLSGADQYIDASELDTEEKVYEACDKYTIFGRVTPKQKKQLVNSLKAKGYTVGMTGDGVNDVMALKEADCSIAMAAGSEASRAVAQLVLLDSDFASLPSVVAEGRRVINNIERAASLFLVKTTFSSVLTILCIIFGLSYPFEAIQLTLVSSLFVGIPSFFLALEPNNQKVTGGFLTKVFKRALPAGFTISLLIFLLSYTYSNIGYNVSAQVATMATYVYAAVSFIVLAQVCMPYTKERLFLMAIMFILFIWCITTSFMASIFSLYPLITNMYLKMTIAILCVIPTMLFMRVEIEAIQNLIKEVRVFFKKHINNAKNIFNRNK